jgi:hypothetical protein
VFIKNEQFFLIYIKKFKLSWGSLINVTKNNFTGTNISVKKMGQKSVIVIVCVKNILKEE